MSWMSKLAKKNENTPKTQKNTNLLKTKRTLNIEMSAKWAQYLHLACQGGDSHPCPPSVTPLFKS